LALLGHAQGCLESRHWFRSREGVVLASTFEAEILPLAPLSKGGADLAEGGNEAEGATPPPGDA
jgi:hypothetical protein